MNPKDLSAAVSNSMPSRFASFAASVVGFAMFDNIAFKPVYASLVLTPASVVAETAASTSSSETPNAEAVEATCPNPLESSSIVVLPNF